MQQLFCVKKKKKEESFQADMPQNASHPSNGVAESFVHYVTIRSLCLDICRDTFIPIKLPTMSPGLIDSRKICLSLFIQSDLPKILSNQDCSA